MNVLVSELRSVWSARALVWVLTRREVAAQQAATETYRQARDLSRETYEAGTTTFLDLLDAERSAGITELALAAAIRGLANDWTALQVAAGRGWATQPGAREFDVDQPRAGQVRFGQFRPGQISFGQFRPGQISAGQVRPGQISFGQVRPGQVTAAE